VVVSPKRLVLEKMPPPRRFTRLSEKVELFTVTVPPPELKMPAPSVALLPEKVESLTVAVASLSLYMPPAVPLEVLPERVALLTSRVPKLRMAPSSSALLPLMVELVIVRVPLSSLEMPPPRSSTSRVFPLEMVIPEMVTSVVSPVTVKILKCSALSGRVTVN
jgi:hypothetical protein